MERSDVIIIGAGVLGCFAARALRRFDVSVTVLEAAEDVCTGVSRGGSGIIYAGYDMKPGTRKARMTTDACVNFPALCRTLGVKYRHTGSLVVSFGEKADAVLKKKLDRGLKNGVPGIRLLDRKEALEMEPLLSPAVTSALYAPGTCTVDPWELGTAAYENAAANGARFLFGRECTGIERSADGFRVTASGRFRGAGPDAFPAAASGKFRGAGLDAFPAAASEETFSCKVLVNCAGISADKLHELVSPPTVRIKPSSADYIVLDDNASPVVSHVIFHETETGEKGLTLIPTAAGNLLIGQTEREARAAGDPTEENGIRRLADLCAEVVPSVPADRIMRTFAVPRPVPYSVELINGEWLQSENGSHHDFGIQEENGFISLIGIRTPGLTCSSELAEDITGRVLSHLGGASPNQAFDPVRERPVKVSELAPEERDDLIKKDPAYGRIVCMCRDITEGEIRDAVRRGARTLSGIKYRTGALMGSCQGSRCLMDVLTFIHGKT